MRWVAAAGWLCLFVCACAVTAANQKQASRTGATSAGTAKGSQSAKKQNVEKAAAKQVGAVAPPKKANFLVMLVDDLGYGDISPFGNTTLQTPNMDRLAAGGAKLTQSLSAAAICTPSRAALLTGRLPVRYGLAPRGRPWDVILMAATPSGLPPNETTLPKILGWHGYRRSLVGKWHLGDNCNHYGDHCHHPITHGFDSFYGLPMTNLKDFGDDGEVLLASGYPNLFPICYALQAAGLISALFLRRRSCLLMTLALLLAAGALSFAVFMANWRILSSLLMRDFDVVEQPMRLRGLSQRLVAETQEKLEGYAKDSQPFFHMHAFSKVHTALDVLPPFRGRSRHGLYGDSVLELDWAVGAILDTLDRLDLADNTLVYFTSDNGGHLEERGVHGDVQGGHNGGLRGGKSMGSMEGGIRMATMLRYPPRVRPGTVVDLPVSTMDVMPTVLKLAGVDVAKELPGRIIDGRDMMPLVSGEATSSPHEYIFHYCKSTIHAVRWMEDPQHTWKVHLYWPPWFPGTERCAFVCQCHDSVRLGSPRIYNIQQDMYERKPLPSTDPRYAIVLARIRRAMEKHTKGVADVPIELTWPNHMWRPWLQACCNPPWCHCSDPKYPSGWSG